MKPQEPNIHKIINDLIFIAKNQTAEINHYIIAIISLIKSSKTTKVDAFNLITEHKDFFTKNFDLILHSNILTSFEKLVISTFLNTEKCELKAKEIINKTFLEKDFETLRKIYYFLFLANRKISNIEPIDNINNIPLEAYTLQRIEEITHNEAFFTYREKNRESHKKRILVVGSIFSPNPLGAHYNLTFSIIKTLFNYNSNDEKFDVGFALSGESTFNIFGYDVRTLDKRRVEMHQQNWLKTSNNIDNFYCGCATGVEDGTITKEFISWVNNFSPSIILFIGDAFESKFYRQVLYKHYPIAFFPMAVGNDPKGNIDGILCKQDVFYERMVKKKYNCLIEPITPIFDIYLPDGAKGDYFFTQNINDVVFVTPLHGDRISKIFEKSLGSEDIEAFCKLFEDNSNLIWVLVGQSSLEPITNKVPHLIKYVEQRRIINLNFVNNLRSVFKACDCVFVIPGMTGGNQGVSTAMADGLAVLSSDYADSAGIAPVDTTYSSNDEMTNIVRKLCSSRDFLSQSKYQALSSISKFSPANVAGEWGHYLKKVIAFGTNRIK
ncbi:glycosyltransferase family 4 protein [Oceanimonas doudoroffii]|uniref:glycosyltransferase family 4 protein n=1 Tax=Oceanimonas doudoroffii TaxID=84158 RepID=UPI00113FC738|nr:glycosyltransferase family 4 protein [Oceanimonas doudoroffii]